MHKLTEHFSLEEMTVTQIRDYSNLPLPSQLANLYKMAIIMEDVRVRLREFPIIVTSGFRSREVNQAVGGSPTSSHMDGLACDFICPRFGTPDEVYRTIASSSLNFDQLILEITWVHIGIGNKMRRQLLNNSRNDWLVPSS